MKTKLTSMLVVAGFAAIGALPLSLAIDNMRLSIATCLFVGGAAVSAAVWLGVLVTMGAVKRLGLASGALLGFLSFATVIAVLFSLPADPGATAMVKDRLIQAGFLLVAAGLYPVVTGGVFGFILRKLPLQHAA
jgi:hypothetical protein